MTTWGAANFFYVSETKIDYLYNRYSPARRLRALDQITGLTIGMFGFVIGGSRSGAQTSPRQKLRRVQRPLEESGDVGSVDEPKKYFYGRITMHYGAFDMVNPAVIYLIGETDRTIVALGGSLKNVQGRDPDTTKARENAQVILSEVEVARAVRRAQLDKSPRLITPVALYDRAGLEGNPRLEGDATYNVHPSKDQWAVDIAKTLWRWSPGNPPITVITLAEKEEWIAPPAEIASRTQKHILVGSPVFVTRD